MGTNPWNDVILGERMNPEQMFYHFILFIFIFFEFFTLMILLSLLRMNKQEEKEMIEARIL